MRSRTTADFRKRLKRLPERVQAQALRAFRLWMSDPYHNSLQFKQISETQPVYSARVGLHWRVMAVKDADTIDWFWIGSHAEYDRLVDQLR